LRRDRVRFVRGGSAERGSVAAVDVASFFDSPRADAERALQGEVGERANVAWRAMPPARP